MLARIRHSGAFILIVGLLTGCTSVPPAIPPVAPEPLPEPVYLTLAAVGDIMLGTDYPQDHLPPNDGAQLLAGMAPVLQAADIAFGNLEGTLLDGGEPVKQCQDPARCYVFRSPSRYAGNFQQAGFDVISLANNHARDFGEEGRSASMQALAQVGIQHSGRMGDIASWTVKGQRVGLIAFAPFKNSHDMLNIPAAQALVARMKADHDIVLISFHGGAEGLEALQIPFASEFYYGEDRGDVVAFAHAVVDAGADVVLGHGPHVPRAVELYQGRLIAYSLGNFCTYYGISVTGLKGLAPVLEIKITENGEFVGGRIISARQQRPLGPQPDATYEAARLIKRLTEQDFPETPLSVDSTGIITKHMVPATRTTSLQ
jgi:poly-gamma-glutamate capsule biosynthesis protein CapA/YwtB (metallophosphatase superfamily)